MRRVVLSGGGGFVGKSLRRHLDRSGISYKMVSHNRIFESATDSEAYKNLFTELKLFKPDTFIHLAWGVQAKNWRTAESQEEFIEASSKFLQLLRRLPIEQTIGIGTCLEYEPSALALSENSLENRSLQYTRDKLNMKRVFQEEAHLNGYVTTWVRLFFVYGPNDLPTRLIPQVLGLTLQNLDIALENPYMELDYLHVDDVSKALATIALRRFSGTINVGSGNPITAFEIAQQMHKLAKSDSRIIVDSNSDFPKTGFVADNSLLKSLGWELKIPMEDGLRQLQENTFS